MAKAERKADHGDEKLYALRHSTAHVMAGAVLELFPEAKFGFGPPVQDGFYYDFDLPRPLTPDDLGTIEAKMRDVTKQDLPFEHRDMSNPQLQRVNGTVWPDQKQLDDYLKRLQEIERRDHRVLGKELELFRIDDELGSGLVLWLPNLSVVREELENWWRRLHHERGYTLVYTPHIASEKIYQRSGH